MRFPFDGNPEVTTPFAYRWLGVYWKGWGGRHPGEDVSMGTGTTLYAMTSGKVTFAGWDNSGMSYGYIVAILKDGWYFTTAHMSRIDVKVGQTVKEGQVIGKSGATGLAKGAHLHWEISNDPSFKAPFSAYVDPRKFINERKEDMFQGKTAKEWFSVALKYDKRIKNYQANYMPTADYQKVVKIKDGEIARLNKELSAKQVSPDGDVTLKDILNAVGKWIRNFVSLNK